MKNKYAENNHNKYQSIKNVSFDIGTVAVLGRRKTLNELYLCITIA